MNFPPNQGGNIYTNVYSSVNGNQNNFNFNEEIINNGNGGNQRNQEQEQYEKHIKELKNYKYKQLVRERYSEYVKSLKQENRNHQE